MLEEGLIKYYLKTDGKRKEWIISIKAMDIWFSKKKYKIRAVQQGRLLFLFIKTILLYRSI